MKYMGSKNRISKDILPIILKNRTEGQWFIDLFCGGCNLSDKVTGNVIANDKNNYLIAMWKGLQQNEKRPYIITRELYSKAREEYNNRTNISLSDFEIGWIGWMGSYNGRFFDGGYSGHNVNGRDYISEQIKNTEKQIPNIKHIKFFSKDYSEFNFKESCIIYCDIPYYNTKQYSTSKDFNYLKFWEWCRNMVLLGHQVFVSEYEAPEDFTCIWEKPLKNSMHQKNTKSTIEKLFTYRPE